MNKLSQDRYGTASLVYSLVSLISSPYTKAPLSIAIDAKWGAGKSSVVGMAQKELETLGIKSMLFNAWYHQEEKHLLSALMQGMLKNLSPRLLSWENLIFRTNLFVRRVLLHPDSLLVFLLLSALLYLAWSVDFKLPDYYGEFVKILSVGAFGLYIFKLAQPFSEATRWFAKKYKTIFSFKNFDAEIGLRDEFTNEINDFISHMGKVVIFIDDLDRCKDEDIFKIMQTVNYLSSIKNVFIVMAVDKERVVAALRRHYTTEHIKEEESKKLAEDYLEKIFNITIKIPDTSSQFYEKYGKREESEKRCQSIKEHALSEFIKRLWVGWFGMGLLIALLLWQLDFVRTTLDDSAKRVSEIVQHERNTTKAEDIKKSEKVNPVEQNNTDKTRTDVKIVPPAPIKPVESVNNKASIIPANIAEPKWYGDVGAIVALLSIALMLFIGGLALVRGRKQKEQYAAQIWEIVAKKKNLTPRAENILFNKINFFLSLGEKRYTDNTTLGNFLQFIRLRIFDFVL
ncbi:MAG TPA: hypothetical protein ENL00_05060, partial [Nitratifractor sp.]|nr:hypothetical protein [Nitratifractor sp.]